MEYENNLLVEDWYTVELKDEFKSDTCKWQEEYLERTFDE